MKQYDDPVEVRRSEAEDPDRLLWRGRRADDEQQTHGVLDLPLDRTDGRWQLVGCLD